MFTINTTDEPPQLNPNFDICHQRNIIIILLYHTRRCYIINKLFSDSLINFSSGKSDNDDAAAETDSDCDMVPTGLMSFMKSFTSGSKGSTDRDGGQTSSAARAKAQVKPKMQSSRPRVPPTSNASQPLQRSDISSSGGVSLSSATPVERKVVVGTAGGSKQKKRKSDEPDQKVIDTTTTDKSGTKKSRTSLSADGVSESDQSTLDSFDAKLDPLKIISPPVSDAPFRASLQDHNAQVTNVLNELRVKKKSAERRSGSKSNTSDMLFLARLSEMENELKEMQKIIRCYLTNWIDCFVC